MISSLSSGNLSITPATRDRPRFVPREAIEAFERANPALRGIGAIMIREGIWVLTDENSSENKDSMRTPGMARISDTTRKPNVHTAIDTES